MGFVYCENSDQKPPSKLVSNIYTNTSGTFTLSTMYPRQLLGGDKDSETLRALELCPSSVLLLLRGTVTASSSGSGSSPPVSNSGGFFGMISHLFWSLIVQPAQGAWFWISTFFTGNNRPPTSGSSDSSGESCPKFLCHVAQHLAADQRSTQNVLQSHVPQESPPSSQK
ncbi:uncharacterized protein LOC143920298 [Arctopsyche grandis]|uniref:uncharacterized protein LOC143920298 n=1 Tax=Arctopsyche grandis TaxID=121162 RepID=UPI00406D8A21